MFLYALFMIYHCHFVTSHNDLPKEIVLEICDLSYIFPKLCYSRNSEVIYCSKYVQHEPYNCDITVIKQPDNITAALQEISRKKEYSEEKMFFTLFVLYYASNHINSDDILLDYFEVLDNIIHQHYYVQNRRLLDESLNVVLNLKWKATKTDLIVKRYVSLLLLYPFKTNTRGVAIYYTNNKYSAERIVNGTIDINNLKIAVLIPKELIEWFDKTLSKNEKENFYIVLVLFYHTIIRVGISIPRYCKEDRYPLVQVYFKDTFNVSFEWMTFGAEYLDNSKVCTLSSFSYFSYEMNVVVESVTTKYCLAKQTISSNNVILNWEQTEIRKSRYPDKPCLDRYNYFLNEECEEYQISLVYDCNVPDLSNISLNLYSSLIEPKTDLVEVIKNITDEYYHINLVDIMLIDNLLLTLDGVDQNDIFYILNNLLKTDSNVDKIMSIVHKIANNLKNITVVYSDIVFQKFTPFIDNKIGLTLEGDLNKPFVAIKLIDIYEFNITKTGLSVQISADLLKYFRRTLSYIDKKEFYISIILHKNCLFNHTCLRIGFKFNRNYQGNNINFYEISIKNNTWYFGKEYLDTAIIYSPKYFNYYYLNLGNYEMLDIFKLTHCFTDTTKYMGKSLLWDFTAAEETVKISYFSRICHRNVTNVATWGTITLNNDLDKAMTIDIQEVCKRNEITKIDDIIDFYKFFFGVNTEILLPVQECLITLAIQNPFWTNIETKHLSYFTFNPFLDDITAFGVTNQRNIQFISADKSYEEISLKNFSTLLFLDADILNLVTRNMTQEEKYSLTVAITIFDRHVMQDSTSDIIGFSVPWYDAEFIFFNLYLRSNIDENSGLEILANVTDDIQGLSTTNWQTVSYFYLKSNLNVTDELEVLKLSIPDHQFKDVLYSPSSGLYAVPRMFPAHDYRVASHLSKARYKLAFRKYVQLMTVSEIDASVALCSTRENLYFAMLCILVVYLTKVILL